MRRTVLLAALIAGCARSAPPEVIGVLAPPRPLDVMAREAAERLLASPADLTLDGANGLSRLGARLERADWVAAARQHFEERLANSAPLLPAEAAAFRERWSEVDLDPRWRARLLAEGQPASLAAPAPRASLEACRVALLGDDPNRLLWAWGRAHDWFGHVWIEGARAALGLDGFEITPVRDPEPGWRARDTLGVARSFALRRAGDHAGLMWVDAGGEVFLAAAFGGEAGGHAH
ncbi:MAG: hypothetical protein EYC70_16745 [Planctomycetota bacterium]|nr:MAG: hypothetical protein EYC70_16745 [Planctomycetota bacterium]